ncbi:hypothetical protein BKA80DRAFT_275074 [Phyllosticta citrichinensis]
MRWLSFLSCTPRALLWPGPVDLHAGTASPRIASLSASALANPRNSPTPAVSHCPVLLCCRLLSVWLSQPPPPHFFLSVAN